MSTQLITVEQAAALLGGVHPKTVRTWLREGRLTGSMLTSRIWRVDAESVQRMIEAGRVMVNGARRGNPLKSES